MESLVANAQAINRLLARYGVKFGIYKNNEFIEQLFPFDPVPRVISAEEFEILEQGLKQRVNALNAFLKDIYTDKKIIKDGVVPDNFVFSSSGFLPECDNFVPPRPEYSLIFRVSTSCRPTAENGSFLKTIFASLPAHPTL